MTEKENQPLFGKRKEPAELFEGFVSNIVGKRMAEMEAMGPIS